MHSDITEPSPRRPRGLGALWLGGVVLFGLVVLGALGFRALRGAPSFHGTPYPEPEAAADFTLTDHTSNPVRLSEYRGKTVLLFFGFTHCPDVCPLTLSKLSRVLKEQEVDAEDLQVLLVTVDPERDTPAALAGYVSRFGPWVRGLTGDTAALTRVYKAYGVYAEPQTPEPHHAGAHPTVSHTTAIFGIDRDGQLRVLMAPDDPDASLADDIRTLLRL